MTILSYISAFFKMYLQPYLLLAFKVRVGYIQLQMGQIRRNVSGKIVM
jgi:hypothetical protein